ncbi:MAG: hypothetical protein GX050_07320 [Firmicutes bacterium]|nr:hypothetical protein [Bacillota bacterium]
MVKKDPKCIIVLLILIQTVAIFSLQTQAKGEVAAAFASPEFSGYFSLIDANQNMVPDHLGFTLNLPAEYSGEVLWVCGELQAMINNQWQTIDYTARNYPGSNGGEPTLVFYGGELKRLKVSGPFRIIVQIKGVSIDLSGLGGFSPAYRHEEFEVSDLVLSNQGAFSTAFVQNQIYQWAAQQGIRLGPLGSVTFSFDRWRFDFTGEAQVSPKRVWYAPDGRIDWVEH